ncbi:uncharacterized protein SCODWIG_03451 [Saccharomycodes ludwigii]|uniref:Protein DML1 n=1 Tax=Saccharomycodes ludwigii TaxID=36035 RepID=A0A376BC37_9ASCO|nr:hypothetical protein SCDLUD_002210 [Saccharomycodes ludwigii]KAH3902389.1 hypothetical protein SCDLUD_002210 [Saccharomycodes ludwigii]SSD61690.1 uncharacterized protein SCODWIG_03451 [Saccharomycodes ludwigii]
MQEILNLSLSHRSNHLITQFYNIQESLLQLNTGLVGSKKSLKNDPKVFLNCDIIGGPTKYLNYTPRCILWDAKYGNGSLSKYEYTEKNNHQTDDNVQVIYTSSEIKKSEYMEKLDLGVSTEKVPIDQSHNTKYWTDYNKLIYSPNSFVFLKNWYHNDDGSTNAIPIRKNELIGNEKNNSQQFNNPQFGTTEYDLNKEELWDNSLHYFLESSDNLQGINLISDVSTGWGGILTSLYPDLKDELPKINIFTWTNQSIHNTNVYNEIENYLDVIEYSNLVFPLYYNNNTNIWKSSSSQALIFQTINSLFDDKSNAISCQDLLYSLNDGIYDKRNLVSSIKCNVDNVQNKSNVKDYSYVSYISNNSTIDNAKIFNEVAIIRDDSSDSNVDTNYTPDRHKHVYKTYQLDYNNLDTIDNSADITKINSLTLQIDNKPKKIFKNWYKIIDKTNTKILQLHIGSNNGSKDDFKNDIANLIEAYQSTGYYDIHSDDSDYDSDYY